MPVANLKWNNKVIRELSSKRMLTDLIKWYNIYLRTSVTSIANDASEKRLLFFGGRIMILNYYKAESFSRNSLIIEKTDRRKL
ncbi:MAG: hypothetical protein K0S18_792 [Anaerocolumna sp.]|nr:hypothetical protein [Anaerocolumna sp.]